MARVEGATRRSPVWSRRTPGPAGFWSRPRRGDVDALPGGVDAEGDSIANDQVRQLALTVLVDVAAARDGVHGRAGRRLDRDAGGADSRHRPGQVEATAVPPAVTLLRLRDAIRTVVTRVRVSSRAASTATRRGKAACAGHAPSRTPPATRPTATSPTLSLLGQIHRARR